MIAPNDLREIIRTGLLSFPVTPFDGDDRFNPRPFAAHLEWLSSYPVAGLIVAGGTGELFSLTPSEVVEVVRTARGVAGLWPFRPRYGCAPFPSAGHRTQAQLPR